jgi:hypothetical protein
MATIAFYVFLAGAAGIVFGMVLQMLGSLFFSHFKNHDSKELAGLAGLRLSAVFAIAVGLIFSSSHTHYVEAKTDLLNEARLIGTMYVLSSDGPEFSNSREIRSKLLAYTRILAENLDEPQTADQAAEKTNKLLLEICKLTATDDLSKSAGTIWLRSELEKNCSQLIGLRGKKRVWMLTSNVEIPFWIFFFISFGFLAFLFGVFERNPLNRLFVALFYFGTGATAILIFWMADPYHGPSRIDSAPLKQLVTKMHSIGQN